MNLFEMNIHIARLMDQLLETYDPETGEVKADVKSDLDALTEERDTKLENIGLYIKSLTAEAEAIKAEEDRLAQRRKSKEAMLKRLKDYVAGSLLADGQKKFETPRVAYSFRRSESVSVTGELPKQYTTKEVTFKPNKVAIKEALKAGKHVRGAELVVKENLQIK